MLEKVLKCHHDGSLLLGICGGFQMLGNTIRDPKNLESKTSECAGLGLFDMDTTFVSDKLTRQIELKTVKSRLFKKGLKCQGYEIHMGRTTFKSNYPSLFSRIDDENAMNFGITNKNGTVIGTYLHGFFNNNPLRQELLSYIRLTRNIDNPIKLFNFDQFKQDELDRLCNLLTESIKMNEVSALIGI